MYLYFNKKGQLKEIINDEGLRQGNYGVNKMYVYIEDLDYTAIDAGFLLPSSAIAGPARYDTFTDPQYIPFDAKRDLLFFKYNKLYTFLVIDLEADQNGNSPLDEAGVVHCEFAAILSNGSQLMLGDVNFNVEASAVANQKQVASQEYLSLSDYTFLKHINSYQPVLPLSLVPYTGAVSNLDLGSHELSANKINVGNLTIEQTELNAFEIGGNYQDTLNLSFSEVDINGNKVLTEDDDVISSSELETALSDYLPLSGGEVTGDISLLEKALIVMEDSVDYVALEKRSAGGLSIAMSDGDDETEYVLENADDNATHYIATKDWVSGQSYVTYTATDNLDLGENELKFTANQNEGRMYYDGDDLYILTSDGDLVLNPDGVVRISGDEVATKDWVQDQGYLTEHQSLAGLVPYTGATSDLNLGTHELDAGSIVITPDPTDALTSTVIRNTGIQYVRHPNNVFKNATFSFPDVTGNKTLATTDDLSGYVTYTAANDLNINGYDITEINELNFLNNAGLINVDGNNDMNIETSSGAIILNPDTGAYIGSNSSNANLIATQGQLPKKGVIGTFNTNNFTNTGSNYVLEDIPLSGFISGSDLLIITWGGCFAICPIPVSGPGRVAAALWNSNGESQVVRIKYELKSNNTLLDISLAGGFTPPSNFDGYIINYKIV